MTFRREGINMGLPGFSEYDQYEADPDLISRIKRDVMDAVDMEKVY